MNRKRLFQSGWWLVAVLFAALFGAISLSGIGLGLHDGLDFARFHLLRVHIASGFLGLLLFLLLTSVHLRRLYDGTTALLVLSVLLVFLALGFSELGPVERILLPTALLVIVTPPVSAQHGSTEESGRIATGSWLHETKSGDVR